MAIFTGNGIELCFEQTGARTDPPVILIHGIGCQLVQWPDAFIDGLAEQALRIVRMDNRDMGHSAWFTEAGSVDVAATMAAMATGDRVEAPYSLADMALDVVALLDHLGLADAHIVGLSMGGMIGQHLAFDHGERVRSLTSIMSSSGRADLPPADPEVAAALVTPPPADDRDSRVAHSRQVWDLIGGRHYRSSEQGLGRLAEVALDRAENLEGFSRQLAAIVADGSRVERLGEIRAPTLVIHGEADPLVPRACGEDTAQAIPGARLTLIPRMGHDLPQPLIPELVDLIGGFVREVDALRAEADRERGS